MPSESHFSQKPGMRGANSTGGPSSCPTINLLVGIFHRLSLERTQPQRDFMYDVAALRRSARCR